MNVNERVADIHIHTKANDVEMWTRNLLKTWLQNIRPFIIKRKYIVREFRWVDVTQILHTMNKLTHKSLLTIRFGLCFAHTPVKSEVIIYTNTDNGGRIIIIITIIIVSQLRCFGVKGKSKPLMFESIRKKQKNIFI